MAPKKVIWLGLDSGSISTNSVAIDANGKILASIYRRTMGNPIKAIQDSLQELKDTLSDDMVIMGVGTTGSARSLIGHVVGADIVKNEITAHGTAASFMIPNVRTVLEIGGQDSKLIILNDGIVLDFAMNTVCAAGTGSFLDHQATRLGIDIKDFGAYALKSESPAQIAGRCSVFAESDMIHKQQIGTPVEDIVFGLCLSLGRNFVSNLAKGKNIQAPIIFQGGVAANSGMKRAFEKILGQEIIVPEYHDVMGAIGMALIAKKLVNNSSLFKGFNVSKQSFKQKGKRCEGCANFCELISIIADDKKIASWGSRCGEKNEVAKELVTTT